jgi:hypothetical protein
MNYPDDIARATLEELRTMGKVTVSFFSKTTVYVESIDGTREDVWEKEGSPSKLYRRLKEVGDEDVI